MHQKTASQLAWLAPSRNSLRRLLRHLVQNERRLSFPLRQNCAEKSRPPERLNTLGKKVFNLPKTNSILILFILCCYAFYTAIVHPNYLSSPNLISILMTVAVSLPALIGMQWLLITAKFDLSLGAIAASSAVIGALAYNTLHNHAPLALALPITFCISLAWGTFFGLFNGLLITKLKMNPLIVTLATTGIIHSLGLVLSDGAVIYQPTLPDTGLFSVTLISVPLIIVVSAILALLAQLATANIRGLRRLYSIGQNSDLCEQQGIQVNRTIYLTFTAAACLAALTGFLQFTRTSAASPLLFQSLSLDLIAACIIGGANLRGGHGTIVSAVLGAILIAATKNLVIFLGISVYYKELFVGILVLIAMGITHLRSGAK